jgi:endogenous inhibitor of DNA gyrase (YacG/DUF329 family)
MVTVVKCPACAAPVRWSETSRWRPFCSERCKTVDLGAWAANRHVIPGDPLDLPVDASTDATSESSVRQSGDSRQPAPPTRQ